MANSPTGVGVYLIPAEMSVLKTGVAFSKAVSVCSDKSIRMVLVGGLGGAICVAVGDVVGVGDGIGVGVAVGEGTVVCVGVGVAEGTSDGVSVGFGVADAVPMAGVCVGRCKLATAPGTCQAIQVRMEQDTRMATAIAVKSAVSSHAALSVT
jgi:hypothetical protein